MKKLLCAVAFSTSFIVTASLYADTAIHTSNIIQDTLKGSPNCLHYKVIGTCFWLRCGIKGCHVETTLKVQHYLPDLVVTVFTRANNNPWHFAKTVIDPEAYQVGKLQIKKIDGMNLGFGDEHDNSMRDLNDRFHEVDIIGNPALPIFKKLLKFLPSTARPFKPYYSSLLDAQNWRFLGVERYYPASQIPTMDDIGTPILNDWGNLYPRTGFVNQPNAVKAAAVDALRAADIITLKVQPHLYFHLSNHCGTHCHAAKIKINSNLTQFQMVYPNVENQCVIFGKNDLPSSIAMKGQDRYVWILWRFYHGCLPDAGAKYLSDINI